MTATCVAMAEEEWLAWYDRADSRRAVRRQVVQDGWDVPWWRIRTSAAFVRQASAPRDCEAKIHAHDDFGDAVDDDCSCASIQEEGWFFPCEATDPDAIPVWRVEGSEASGWWRRHRELPWKLLFGDLRPRASNALWGGRIERRATKLDRLLGYDGLVVLGARQERLGSAEWSWHWCDVCGGHTPHRSRSRVTGRSIHPLCQHPEHDAKRWPR